MEFINDTLQNWWQFALVFVATCYLCAVQETWPLSRAKALEIIKGSAAVVIVFIFLSSGRGCSSSGSTMEDCRPAGPGIYNTC
jgi:hypothetical protein